MGPKLGALGMTFTVMRAMQFASLVAIIGMTANFVSEIAGSGATPPSVLVGTLVVSCLATLYIAVTYILYYDNQLPLLIASGADTAILIAVIVVACTIGKPLSYLSCPSLPTTSSNTASFLESVGENVFRTSSVASAAGTAVNYFVWVGASRKTCYEIKAVWGLSIALCVLFAFTAIVSACLWRRLRVVGAAVKDIEG